jgi:hypothetical protein
MSYLNSKETGEGELTMRQLGKIKFDKKEVGRK